MLIKRPADIPSSEITPEGVYLDRRRFIRSAGLQPRPPFEPFTEPASASSSTRLSVIIRSRVEFRELLVNMVVSSVMVIRAPGKAPHVPTCPGHFGQHRAGDVCQSERATAIMITGCLHFGGTPVQPPRAATC